MGKSGLGEKSRGLKLFSLEMRILSENTWKVIRESNLSKGNTRQFKNIYKNTFLRVGAQNIVDAVGYTKHEIREFLLIMREV